jgi:hypothetical protein
VFEDKMKKCGRKKDGGNWMRINEKSQDNRR